MKSPFHFVNWLLIAGLVMILNAPTFAGPLHERWDEKCELTLVDGSTLQVRQSGSRRRYFGVGHGLGFGGGDLKEKLEFSRGGKKFVWEGGHVPVLLQFDGDVPVIVVFDRESKLENWGLRYFRLDGEWKELPLKQFPRRIARQNLWLTKDEYNIVQKCDPEDVNFQRSLMARFWFCIATGKTHQEAETEAITAEFLREFKASMGR